MKVIASLIAIALLAACASDAQARIFGNNVSKSVTVVRGGRVIEVQKIVVEQQRVQQIKVVPVVAGYGVQAFSAGHCQQQIVTPVVSNHCQAFFK